MNDDNDDKISENQNEIESIPAPLSTPLSILSSSTKVADKGTKVGTLYLTSRIVMEPSLGSREGSEIISPTVILTSSNTQAEMQVLNSFVM